MEETFVHIKQSCAPSSYEIPINYIFLAKYGVFPQKMVISPALKDSGVNVVFHVRSILDRLVSKYGTNSEYPIVRSHFHPCSKKYYTSQQLHSLPSIDGVFIHFKQCFWVTNYINNSKESIQPDYLLDRHFLVVEQLRLFYVIGQENFVEKLAYDLINDDTLSLVEPKIATLNLIGKHKDRCGGPGSFYLTSNTYIKKPHIDNLALNYGEEDFLLIHNKILTWLNKKDASGLVLLHGPPGSGKTHYIRYLLNCITNEVEKHLLYIPPNMIDDLSNPTLLPLLVRYPNSVLIIEDGEESLSRSRISSQSVSNLLNLSDGLLNDGIQARILATFNCPLQSLDAALLRPGRLIVQHCFPETLTVENARYLAESLGIIEIDQINKPFSLADIYAMRKDNMAEAEGDNYEIISINCPKCSMCKYYDDDDDEEE